MGAGPVGYLALMSSFLRGAARIFSVDHWPIRLNLTKDLGAEIINFDDEDPVDVIKKERKGKGIKCIDAVGFEAVGNFAGNGTIGSGIDNGNGDSANGGS